VDSFVLLVRIQIFEGDFLLSRHCTCFFQTFSNQLINCESLLRCELWHFRLRLWDCELLLLRHEFPKNSILFSDQRVFVFAEIAVEAVLELLDSHLVVVIVFRQQLWVLTFLAVVLELFESQVPLVLFKFH
jgi:hypothetical protein